MWRERLRVPLPLRPALRANTTVRCRAARRQTVGAAFTAKKTTVDDVPITLGIWDTAGSERYEAMSRIYYRGARAAVVCYGARCRRRPGPSRHRAGVHSWRRAARVRATDISDQQSYDRSAFWVSELLSNEPHCRIYLCGTKRDLVDERKKPRQVDYHTCVAADVAAPHAAASHARARNRANEYAHKINATFFETSSKTGQGIAELFTQIAEDYVRSLPSAERDRLRRSIAVPETAVRLDAAAQPSAAPSQGCC